MEQSTAEQSKRPFWLSIAVYYLLACAISWPFFWQRDMLGISVPTRNYMWGPGIAAIITMLIFRKRHTRTITFFGTSTIKSLLFYLVPIVILSTTLALFAPSDLTGESPLVVALGLPLLGFFNILGEELGWRGFLQDAVRPLHRVTRYILIGGLWEFWHFTTRTTGKPIGAIILTLAVSYPLVILFSAIIGKLTDRTRSLIVAVSLHAWLNILFELRTPYTYVIFALTLIYWFFLLRSWQDAELHSIPTHPGTPHSATTDGGMT